MREKGSTPSGEIDLGAALMYMLDPDGATTACPGARQLAHAANVLPDAVGATAQS